MSKCSQGDKNALVENHWGSTLSFLGTSAPPCCTLLRGLSSISRSRVLLNAHNSSPARQWALHPPSSPLPVHTPSLYRVCSSHRDQGPPGESVSKALGNLRRRNDLTWGQTEINQKSRDSAYPWLPYYRCDDLKPLCRMICK